MDVKPMKRSMKGLAGMFIIIIVLLGTIAWVFQNNVREAHLVSKEAAINEVRSNRLELCKLSALCGA